MVNHLPEVMREHMKAAARMVDKRFDELVDAARHDSGFCLECGAHAEQTIEPDARGYHCSACSQFAIYGAEEIILMGAPF